MKPNFPARMFKAHEAHWGVRTACTLLVFSLATAMASEAQTYNVLARLVEGDGVLPTSLVQGADGDFYGVGSQGGDNAGGSIFKVTSAGTVIPLYIFCLHELCKDGRDPQGLVQASDGNFYGSTRNGGDANAGSIFRVTTAGAVSTLYSFCPSRQSCTDGVFPEGELIQGSDGDLYGTTFIGGNHDGGTVFKITLSGVFTSLYSFCSQSPDCADGQAPTAGLVEATNGMFYGTTSNGGVNSGGTIFRISPTGKLTTLYNFCSQPDCADGVLPETSLIQAADGKIYGTNSSGIAFRISPLGGALTILHAFTSSEGAQVQNLIQATDGSFYGTARSGGSSNLGTLFKMDSAGSVTVLFNFCKDASCQRSFSPSGVMQATSGLFYGTTLGIGNGTVFTFGFPPFIKITPAWGPIGTALTIYGTDLSGATAVTFNGVPAIFTIISPGEITTSVPAGVSSGSVKVTTPSATLVSNVVFHVTQ
ncbi:MAG: choice-of-anchor tandem repeat GloVer-containing protein [Candidatus Sulfotelmatobacter sp.]